MVKSSTGSVYSFRDAKPVEREQDETQDDNAPIGTTKSGYAPPEDGPFECSNCVHYEGETEEQGTCDHPDVIEDAVNHEIALDGDRALVAAKGCCNEFRPEENDAQRT